MTAAADPRPRWQGDGTSVTPPAEDAIGHCSLGKAALNPPIGGALRHAIKGDHAVVGPVPVLHVHRHPAEISDLVMPVHVNPVEGVQCGRSATDRADELAHRVEPKFDSPAAVILERWIVRIRAAVLRLVVRLELWRNARPRRLSVDGVVPCHPLPVQASARLSVAVPKRSALDDQLCPTEAYAIPAVPTGVADNAQTSERLAGQVYESTIAGDRNRGETVDLIRRLGHASNSTVTRLGMAAA